MYDLMTMTQVWWPALGWRHGRWGELIISQICSSEKQKHWMALGDTGWHIGDKAQESNVVRMTSERLDSKRQAVVAAH